MTVHDRDLDPKKPSHAKLLDVVAANRELVGELAEFGSAGYVNPMHKLEVRLDMLLDRIVGVASAARVEFEIEFHGRMNIELEAQLQKLREDPPGEVEAPLAHRNIGTLARMMAADREARVAS